MRVFDRAGVVRVRTVLNPLLWLCAVTTPTSFLAAWLAGFESTMGVVLTAAGCLPVAAAVTAYIWFAIRDPDRLQSEEYMLKQQEFLIELRRGREPHVIDVAAVPVQRVKPGKPASEDERS